MGENILQQKSFHFAIEIVELYKHLSSEKKEFVLSKQILKSGTSIGANVEEAIGGQSEADFMSKLSIAYKEARETAYWIRLLRETNFLEPSLAKKHLETCEELQRIIGSSIKTIKAKRSK
jgi:four helix bundle protein